MTNDMVKFAMKPSGWVVFFRTFFPYQVYRFFWVNGRMLAMIWKSHSHGGKRATLGNQVQIVGPPPQVIDLQRPKGSVL